jgi:uncharacterized protein
MFLNLRRIRAAQERFEKAYAPDVFGREQDGFTVAEPVVLVFDIHKDKDQFRLVGRMQTTIELPCGRCLEPFAWPVDSVFDLRYQPHSANTGEGEVEVEEDDLTTAFYEHDEIDLGHLMREQMYLALPMKPLCRPDCRGLCPTCGANLNQAQCACKNEWEDPRLAVLKKLKAENLKLKAEN